LARDTHIQLAAAALLAAGFDIADGLLAVCANAPEGAARISARVPATVMQFRASFIVIGPIHRRLNALVT
jgi:hypothetical protein